MRIVGKVKVEGLRDLERSLSELPKAVARNTLRRVLIARAEPIAETMRSLAPDDPETTGKGDLRTSIAVGTKLSKRQAKLHRKETKDDRQFAEVFVGAGALPQAHLTEFGGAHNPPVGWARAAWDQHMDSVLDGIRQDLAAEIDKAAARQAKKLARLAAKARG